MAEEAPEAWLRKPLRPGWRPLTPGGGGGRTDVRTYVRTDRTKSPYSIGHRPLRGRCPKNTDPGERGRLRAKKKKVRAEAGTGEIRGFLDAHDDNKVQSRRGERQ